MYFFFHNYPLHCTFENRRKVQNQSYTCPADRGDLDREKVTHIPHFHITHSTPCLQPKILHKLCVLFPLGIIVIPGEIEDTGYAFRK